MPFCNRLQCLCALMKTTRLQADSELELDVVLVINPTYFRMNLKFKDWNGACMRRGSFSRPICKTDMNGDYFEGGK